MVCAATNRNANLASRVSWIRYVCRSEKSLEQVKIG
jgi:hypothetical protein